MIVKPGDSTNWKRILETTDDFIQVLHEELGWFNDEELTNTPRRITDFYREWYSNQNFNFTCFETRTNQMVLLRDISFFSLCSHHALPFFGKCHIGYLPGEKLCGVSKLARVVKKMASRPQMQERMTEDIVEYIDIELDPRWAMVIVEGIHTCMVGRGVKEPASVMITSAIRTKELDEKSTSLKSEFMSLISPRREL